MTREKFFTLDDNDDPIEVDQITWARYFLLTDRVIQISQVLGDVLVTTVFIGMIYDHYSDVGAPLIYKSEVCDQFGEVLAMRRYPTRAAAKSGHADLVEQFSRAR